MIISLETLVYYFHLKILTKTPQLLQHAIHVIHAGSVTHNIFFFDEIELKRQFFLHFLPQMIISVSLFILHPEFNFIPKICGLHLRWISLKCAFRRRYKSFGPKCYTFQTRLLSHSYLPLASLKHAAFWLFLFDTLTIIIQL